MNPRHILPARADRPAQPEPERRQHQAERAAVAAEHDAGPERDHPQAQCLGRACGRLPVLAQPTQEVAGRDRVLIEDRLAAIAVVANGTSRDQDARPPPRAGDRAHQLLRNADAAVAKQLPPCRRPSACHERLAREVDHGVAGLERCGQSLELFIRHGDIDFGAESRPGAGLTPRPHHNGVTGLTKHGNQRPSDEPCGPGDQHPHALVIRDRAAHVNDLSMTKC